MRGPRGASPALGVVLRVEKTVAVVSILVPLAVAIIAANPQDRMGSNSDGINAAGTTCGKQMESDALKSGQVGGCMGLTAGSGVKRMRRSGAGPAARVVHVHICVHVHQQ